MTLISFAQIKHACMHAKFRLIAPTHSKFKSMSIYVVVLSLLHFCVVDAARVIFLKSRNFKILTNKVLISQRRVVVG